MFTGLVEELGTIEALGPPAEAPAVAGTAAPTSTDIVRLTVRAPVVSADAGHGDSIAVNGVCLTVTDVADGAFTVDVVQETLGRTALGGLRPGDRVNLERPLRPTGRLGGHIVQGHVDGVGHIRERSPEDVVTVSLPPPLARYVVRKGSITVDGVSLTVVDVADDWFSVALIPTTLELTTLGRKGPGDPVNLEVDIVAKYVERLMEARA